MHAVWTNKPQVPFAEYSALTINTTLNRPSGNKKDFDAIMKMRRDGKVPLEIGVPVNVKPVMVHIVIMKVAFTVGPFLLRHQAPPAG